MILSRSISYFVQFNKLFQKTLVLFKYDDLLVHLLGQNFKD